MKLSRKIRWITAGTMFFLLGIANVWFGSIRTEELRPLAQASRYNTARDPDSGSAQQISAQTSMSSLRPIAAYEFYRVVVSGGKILCAFGALLLIIGMALQGRTEVSKKFS
jgi:hypothetical protein